MEVKDDISKILEEKANDKMIKSTPKAKYGFETGAPPIVVVVQGGKGVIFLFSQEKQH